MECIGGDYVKARVDVDITISCINNSKHPIISGCLLFPFADVLADMTKQFDSERFLD